MSIKEMIAIDNLSYTYPDGTKALDAVSLRIYKKECVGIIGPNGAGKSTLLLHLNGILKGQGVVKISGEEVRDDNLCDIRRSVGIVFQDPEDQLFMPTVEDDVAFGPINLGYDRKEIESSVNGALEDVDMIKAKKRISHHLSFGEKKRIALATILSMKPYILALDEPTSNLDPKGRCEIMQALAKFDKTKIIATHDLDMVFELCSRTIIFDKGRLVADGPAKEILSDKALLEKHNLLLPFCLQR
ncbi:MAG: energy-coupling factor ABC transporter ATP-binding protein [Candidatus Omnitrophica bacterium]|nr:energy-coupling factor ABC transporter ATP-binding protein [Candidatus Omnitrophota bacterium]